MRLEELRTPCAARAEILVIRASAAFCGPCRWHLGHTRELAAAGVRVLDLFVADEDNAPPSVPDLARLRGLIDAPDRVAVDPEHRLAALDPTHGPLPLAVLVDRRTLRVVSVIPSPDPDELLARVARAAADANGEPAPPAPRTVVQDGHFGRDQWDLIHAMRAPGAPPPDPSNAKADDPAAAAFGQALFADAALAPRGDVACTTCHDPARAFTDRLAQSVGLARLDRNAPSVRLAAHARWQFWDGRADTLWMQALGPIEDPKEMGSSRLFVAHGVRARHRAAYEAVFGALPALDDGARFPPSGRPGDAAWDGMASADRDAVTRVFVNVGKAIAAFERTLRAPATRLDAYAAGDLGALTDDEKHGLFEFFRTGCVQCHWGPRLTDDAFHAVRFPTGRADGAADRGRADAIARLLGSEFRASGRWSDEPSAGARLLALDPARVPARMLGAMKTPSLRGLTATAPYGHGGTVPTLEEVVKLYSTRGLPADDARAVGEPEPWLPRFADSHRDALLPFLRVLSEP